jgi:hypothetical protein
MFRFIGAETKQLHFFVGREDLVKYHDWQGNAGNEVDVE